MDTLEQDRDETMVHTIELGRADGATLGYAAPMPLQVHLWPGGDRPPLAGVTAAWNTVPNSVDVTVPAASLASAEPGLYRLRIRIDPNGDDAWETVARLNFRINAAPGEAEERAIYGTAEDLRTYCSWIEDLQSEAHDETGFIEQRALARQWLDGLIVSKYTPGRGPTDTQFGDSLYAEGSLRDPALKAALESDGLVTDLGLPPTVVEIVSRYALSLILDAQPGRRGDDSYRDLGREHRLIAESKALCLTVEVAVEAGGPAAYLIHLGRAPSFYG